MIQLIDTAVGFVAIMAVLSLLVKSLTSLIKSYYDYYSANLHFEVNSLIQGILGKTLDEFADSGPKFAWLKDVNWKSLGDEVLGIEKIKLLLNHLDPTIEVKDNELQARIDLHLANLRYGFERRMKNLALACGLALCLLCDINSVTIWKTLYGDQQLRTTFATQYAEHAMNLIDQKAAGEQTKTDAPAGTSSVGQSTATGKSVAEKPGSTAIAPAAAPRTDQVVGATPAEGQEKLSASQLKDLQLKEKTRQFHEDIQGFFADVSFGVGRIWHESKPDNPRPGPDPASHWLPCLYEFLGALLTGVLISVGAPYWHDLLRTLSEMRKGGSAASDAPSRKPKTQPVA
jgi:hypothetical protein